MDSVSVVLWYKTWCVLDYYMPVLLLSLIKIICGIQGGSIFRGTSMEVFTLLLNGDVICGKMKPVGRV